VQHPPPLPPKDSAGEGMASLLARRRTTSFYLPASGSPLAAPVPRQTGSPAGALASLASWGTSFSRRRKPIPAPAQTSAPAPAAATVARQDPVPSGSGRTDAQQILQRF